MNGAFPCAHAARKLKGAKPADLRALEPNRFEPCHQSQDLEGSWADDSTDAPRPRRSSHRVKRRVAMLSDPSMPGAHLLEEQVREAAHARGAISIFFKTTSRTEIVAAMARLDAERVDILIIPLNVLFFGERALITAEAARLRLPVVSAFVEFTEAGGLLSYSGSLVESHRRAAWFIDRILKGAKPADLPIEQLSKHELVINLRTARALNLYVPPALLARADEVIE